MDGLTLLASYQGHMGGWGPGGWGFFPFFPLLWIALIGFGIWFFARRRPFNDARRVLADRYARGELDADEYHDKLKHLR